MVAKIEVGDEGPQCFFCKKAPTKFVAAVFMVTRHHAHLGKRKLTAVVKPDAQTAVCEEHLRLFAQSIEGSVLALKALYFDIKRKLAP